MSRMMREVLCRLGSSLVHFGVYRAKNNQLNPSLTVSLRGLNLKNRTKCVRAVSNHQIWQSMTLILNVSKIY